MRSDIRKIVVITGVMLMTSVVTTFFYFKYRNYGIDKIIY